MKKVLAAALICAASSFAAWDYFPVIEYGKGEAKVGFTQGRQGNNVQWGPGLEYFKIRYSPMENLELLSQAGYIFGARLQVVPTTLSAGIDVGFPIPGTNWSFTPNVQFSNPLTDVLLLGTNFQATLYTEDARGNTHGVDLRAGVELDLTHGKSTIWFGCDFNREDLKNKDGGIEIVPMLGYVANPGNLSLGTNIGWAFGEDAGNDPFKTFISLDFSIKF